MQQLDMDNWIRKEQFKLFSQMDYPHFNICANVDITNFYKYVKKHNYSFYNSMIFLACKAANNIPEFRYRIRDGKVVIHESVHPSFTVLSKEDTFSFCTVEYKNDFMQFLRDIEDKLKWLAGGIDIGDEPGRDDLLYVTCIPWVSFTSVTHPIHISPADSIPRISWGKYFEEGGSLKLPLSVQANHALMDGIHVGRYFNDLQSLLNKPEFCFNMY